MVTVLKLLDLFLPILLLYIISFLLGFTWIEAYFWLGAVAGVLLFSGTYLMRGYSQNVQRTLARKIEVVSVNWVFILLALLFFVFIRGDASLISRSLYVIWALSVPLIIIAFKLSINNWLDKKTITKFLFIGSPYLFTKLEQQRLRTQSIEIVYLSIDHLVNVVSSQEIRHIILNLKGNTSDELVKQLIKFELDGIKIESMSHFFEKYLRKCFVCYDDDGVDSLVNFHPYTIKQYVFKRIIDVLLVCSLFLVSFPVMLYSIFRINKESPGPFIFKQKRVGVGGIGFYVYKFRSMHIDAEKNGAQFATQNDPRVYGYGALMRKTRVDELPQIWNVIKGEMHFCGPRAERRIFVNNFENEIPYYNQRHLVRPGISGWAQVMYPYGANTEDARQKLMYDLYYMKYWTVWLEIETLVRTVGVILGRKGL